MMLLLSLASSLALDDPKLPDAIDKPPPEAVAGAPYDIKAWFAPVPPAQNAAPLYLDALFEFGDDMAVCFPPGPETERRRAEARRRYDPWSSLYDDQQKNSQAVTPERIDAVIAPYAEGYRKLETAQQRPRCTFATGSHLASPLPHSQVARHVARVSVLRAGRMIDRGEDDAAIREVDLVLRLSRDLQPRGASITQLVAVAMQALIFDQALAPLLAESDLTIARCDRVVRLLADHDRKALDGYVEGLRAEHLMMRVTIIDATERQDELKAGMATLNGRPVESFLAALRPPGPDGKPPTLTPEDLRAEQLLAAVDAAEKRAAARGVDAYIKACLDLAKRPIAERTKALPDPKSSFRTTGPLLRLMPLLVPNLATLMNAEGRGRANTRGWLAYAAVRRYQLAHDGKPPRDLATACREAKIAVPLDPFDGKPMRLIMQDGQPVVYSVGKDGVDDKGKDSKRDTAPGDLLYPTGKPAR